MRSDPLNRQASRVHLSTERRNPHALEHELPHPVPRTFLSSLPVEVLRELVEGSTLLHGNEALHLELLTRLLHRLRPARDLLVGPLPSGRRLLAHDLPALALDEVGLLQAAHGLVLVPTEHHSPRKLSPCDLRHPLLRLHGPHGRPHRLHCSHCLSHDLKKGGEREAALTSSL